MGDKEMTFCLLETYLEVITNSPGAGIFKRTYFRSSEGELEDILKNGELSCAFFVSSILKMFNLITFQHATVGSTVKDLKLSGWYKIETPQKGAVLLWGPRDTTHHSHLGFYVGNEMAISNSPITRSPAMHHYLTGMANIGPLQEIYWHSSLKEWQVSRNG